MSGVSADKSGAGHKAREIGEIAETTLAELIRIWLAHSGAPMPAGLTPDDHRVDLYVTLPALWSGIGTTSLEIQVKSTSTARAPRAVPGMPSRCLSYRPSKSELAHLREAALGHTHFYVALGVNTEDLDSKGLLEREPSGRFSWFLIDFAAQARRLPDAKELYFPVQNNLNLSTFSLLWGALWTEKFYEPLYAPQLLQAPEIGALLPRIYFEEDRMRDPDFYSDWNFLTDFLPEFSDRFDPQYFSDLTFKLGLSHALGIISTKIFDSGERLQEIFCYCPEALYGTANLWLFSQSYHQFMHASGEVVSIRDGEVNRRLLPLPAEIDEVPPILLATLWHVALLYASMGVEVVLVEQPAKNAGDDHSYYGGGIGYFPWIRLSDDGASWMIQNNQDATTGQHLDFLHETEAYAVLSLGGETLHSVATALGLRQEDIRPPAACPVDLFPAETFAFKYPVGIFGKQMSTALNNIHSVRGRL